MTNLMSCKGCGLLVSPGPRCSRCQRSWERTYARTRPEHHNLYQTTRWKRLAAEVIAGATRCTWCLKPTTKLLADHVLPVEQRPDLAFDRENVRPSCWGCNTRRGRNAKIP